LIYFILFFEKIFDQKLTWVKPAATNNLNQEYIEHKKREEALREQRAKTRVQVQIFFRNLFLFLSSRVFHKYEQ